MTELVTFTAEQVADITAQAQAELALELTDPAVALKERLKSQLRAIANAQSSLDFGNAILDQIKEEVTEAAP